LAKHRGAVKDFEAAWLEGDRKAGFMYSLHHTFVHQALASDDEKRWDAVRSSYEFNYLDDFDLALMNFVSSSILDVDELLLQINKQEAVLQRNKQSGSFESSFRPLHDSFQDNEEEVCSALISGVKNNLSVVSLSNVDAVNHRIPLTPGNA
jgi:hypothetical protein